MVVALEVVVLVTRAGFCMTDSMGSSSLLFHFSALPVLQLRDLNEIAASVVERGDPSVLHVRWWHGEPGAGRLHPLVIGLQVVGEERRRRLVLLKLCLLMGFVRRVVVERQLQ